MAYYSTTQTFGPYGPNRPDAMLKIDVNGGSLTITQIITDPDGVETEVPVENGTITADSSFALQIAGGHFKATVAGGCVYEWNA